MTTKARTIGHLVELPLTSGRRHAIDPAEVVETGTPHGQPGVTLVRLRDQSFCLYVPMDYDTVIGLLQAAIQHQAC